jgi:5-methylcytosine-specific restriction endonuclease McrA
VTIHRFSCSTWQTVKIINCRVRQPRKLRTSLVTTRSLGLTLEEPRKAKKGEAERAAPPEFVARAGHKCQTCGTRDARLDVHHNSYENYGDERPQDLTVLCERCHGLFHRGLQDAS